MATVANRFCDQNGGKATRRVPHEDGNSLKDWECRAFSPGTESGPKDGDRRDAYEREIGMEHPGEPEPHGPHRRVAASILSFDVFPGRQVTPVLLRKPVEAGDTVGCRYHLAWGIDIFFAARVISRFDGLAGGTWRTGFTYRTLDGHPLLGEETFAVEKDVATGRVRVSIRSWSRPEILLARAFYPVARCLQVRGGRGMLEHLGSMALEKNDECPRTNDERMTKAQMPKDEGSRGGFRSP